MTDVERAVLELIVARGACSTAEVARALAGRVPREEVKGALENLRRDGRLRLTGRRPQRFVAGEVEAAPPESGESAADEAVRLTVIELHILDLLERHGPMTVPALAARGGEALKRDSAYKSIENLRRRRLVKLTRQQHDRAHRFEISVSGRRGLRARRAIAEKALPLRPPPSERALDRPVLLEPEPPPSRLSALELLCLELLDRAGGKREAGWFVAHSTGQLVQATARSTLRRMAKRGYLSAWQDRDAGRSTPRAYSMAPFGRKRLLETRSRDATD